RSAVGKGPPDRTGASAPFRYRPRCRPDVLYWCRIAFCPSCIAVMSLIRGIVGVIVGATVTGLWLRTHLVAAQANAARAGDLQRELQERERRLSDLQRELTDARIEAGTLAERLDQERRAAGEKLALVDDAQRKLADAF